LHHLCKGDIKMKKYEIQATNFQLAILLLFNERPMYNEADILTATGIPLPELRRTLKSLLDCRLLLAKRAGGPAPSGATSSSSSAAPAGKEGDDKPKVPVSVLYIYNEKFVSKRKKFKITSNLQQPTQTENTQTRSTVQDDRKLFLQAAIVRIMKARKKTKTQRVNTRSRFSVSCSIFTSNTNDQTMCRATHRKRLYRKSGRR